MRKSRISAARKDAGLDQIVAGAHAIEILGDPEQRLEIAQAALAFLDVGLDQIAGGALLAMALVALGELGGDEFGAGVLGHLIVEAGDQRVVEAALAGEVARLEHRRADGHVGAGEAHAFVDAARGMADGEAEIPEQIEDELDDALAPGRLLVGKQEEQIDIGARRQRAAAIAADGHHRHVLGGAAAFRSDRCGRSPGRRAPG